ncbi:YfcE family phosphodiesterase [Adhaeretor mobilis]|uniref:Phosphoesterase n=1 Tax=Adhaeretor mobilis TaxID=1930276 RepID=A0A517MQX3_9BACT|nr:YfcE family phosphodiesterase [Adhaeretor mobilis]QDS97288.1 phosphodiesterase [Adhaeretor mobilis]
MRLGIVSDSHGHTELVIPAVRMLESLEVDRVLHCGDIGSPEVVQLFKPWPTDFVFGNCDGNQAELSKAITEAGLTCHQEFGELEIEGCRIALLHSHDQRRFRDALESGSYDLVCYGHTHIASIDEHSGPHGTTLALNPGALYRANPHSLAVVELPEIRAELITL